MDAIKRYWGRVAEIRNHPANASQPMRALGKSLAWRYLCRPLHLRWEVSIGPLKLCLRHDDYIAPNIVYFTPFVDFEMADLILRFLRPGDNVLDAGANIGLYTLIASLAVGPSGRVDAVEPIPKTFKRLQETVLRNGISCVTLHQIALAEVEGDVVMTSDLDAINHVQTGGGTQKGGVSVTACRMDNRFSQVSFALAKLDLEGYELPALRGAMKMLSCGNPQVILAESNSAGSRYGHKKTDLCKLLTSFGYEPFSYFPITGEIVFQMRDGVDLFFVHRNARALLSERLRNPFNVAHDRLLRGSALRTLL
jgi:FkbM family methyltransferase